MNIGENDKESSYARLGERARVSCEAQSSCSWRARRWLAAMPPRSAASGSSGSPDVSVFRDFMLRLERLDNSMNSSEQRLSSDVKQLLYALANPEWSHLGFGIWYAQQPAHGTV